MNTTLHLYEVSWIKSHTGKWGAKLVSPAQRQWIHLFLVDCLQITRESRSVLSVSRFHLGIFIPVMRVECYQYWGGWEESWKRKTFSTSSIYHDLVAIFHNMLRHQGGNHIKNSALYVYRFHVKCVHWSVCFDASWVIHIIKRWNVSVMSPVNFFYIFIG